MISTTNVRIKVHYSLVIYIILSMFLGQIKYVLIFLGIVLAHEAGHIITLLAFKGKIKSLTITIIGGIIEIDDQNLTSWQNLFVSLSGILINVLIIIIVSINDRLVSPEIKSIIIAYNKLMIAFNALPIYPLDGSRIIEVFLSCFFDYEYATDISLIVSALFLVVIGIYGMISKSGVIIIISIFLTIKLYRRKQALALSVVRHNALNYAFLSRLNR